jgi:hypothetical protein
MPFPCFRILLGYEGVCELYGLDEVWSTGDDMFRKGTVKAKVFYEVGDFLLAEILDRLESASLSRIQHEEQVELDWSTTNFSCLVNLWKPNTGPLRPAAPLYLHP